ncbi:MAG: 1-acyl-sn-glycerol-3-phosphate acyltransferase [Rhodothermaceae bacterium]|nr:1-acyl-sn-glycerol-3-phosphate acyltransferase [Rhodothermaceae bacterium]
MAPDSTLMKAIRSALTWAALVLLIILWLPLLGVIRLFDWRAPHRATGRTFRYLGNLMTKVNPAWRITRTGTLPANRRGPYVVVSNHQSSADIPVISRLPWEMKWVAKAVLFKLPLAGWMMRLAGDIPVDRGDTASRAAVLPQASEMLKRQCSVMFMPEGTRSKDGRVRRFQDGAFRIAINAGVPVLPLAVDGTMDALPKHGWQFSGADVRLHVFDPIPTDGLTAADAPALRERARQRIVEQIAAWRGVPTEAVDGTLKTGEEDAKSTATPLNAPSGG